MLALCTRLISTLALTAHWGAAKIRSTRSASVWELGPADVVLEASTLLLSKTALMRTLLSYVPTARVPMLHVPYGFGFDITDGCLQALVTPALLPREFIGFQHTAQTAPEAYTCSAALALTHAGRV